MKNRDMPPVLSVVGWSNSGKTTFLVQLLEELTARGHRVGTIKHHHGAIAVDKPGKDTWRHAQAGANAVALAGTSGFALFKEYQESNILNEIINLMPEMDMIITEGFKSSEYPKIEVRRSEINPEPAVPEEELIALVDEDGSSKTVPCFSPGDYSKVADLVEKLFLVSN